MKVTVVGAGKCRRSCAEYIAIKRIASEAVLLDIKEGFAEGKSVGFNPNSNDPWFQYLVLLGSPMITVLLLAAMLWSSHLVFLVNLE